MTAIKSKKLIGLDFRGKVSVMLAPPAHVSTWRRLYLDACLPGDICTWTHLYLKTSVPDKSVPVPFLWITCVFNLLVMTVSCRSARVCYMRICSLLIFVCIESSKRLIRSVSVYMCPTRVVSVMVGIETGDKSACVLSVCGWDEEEVIMVWSDK